MYWYFLRPAKYLNSEEAEAVYCFCLNLKHKRAQRHQRFMGERKGEDRSSFLFLLWLYI